MRWQNWLTLIGLILIVGWTALCVFFQILAIWTIWIALILGLLFGIWALLSLKIVGPDEMAVKVIFGEPKEVSDSGWRFVYYLPGLKCYLVRFPKKEFNFDYTARKVISKQDEYPKGSGLDCGSQVLKVDVAAYITFPRKGKFTVSGNDEALVEILKSQVPIDEESLKDWTEESVISAVRAVLGRMTWRQAKQEQGEVEKQANEVFTKEDGALVKVGFQPDDVRIVIKEIEIPPELETILVRFDRERLEAEAASFEAAQIAEEIAGTYIQMLAQRTGKTTEQIRQEIDGDSEKKARFEEFCQDAIHRRMALDQQLFFDFRAPDSKGIDSTILSAIAAFLRIPRERERNVDATVDDIARREGIRRERERIRQINEAAERLKKEQEEEWKRKRGKK